MTDIEELVKRMRGLAEYVDDCEEAADALEAQAKRVAELEKREKHLEEMFQGWRDEAIKASARIAELEAVLKPFADLWVFPDDLGPEAEEIIRCDPDWDEEANDRTKEDVMVFRGDIRAARAALNGEKE